MIRSTFASYTTATLALRANQRALDIIGQNIANINTEGYTRQRVDLVSFNLNGGSHANPVKNTNAGYGVKIAQISQLRDPFLDVQYRNQIAKVGTADAKQSSMDMLADIFDETDTEGVKHALEMLRSSLNNMNLGVNNESDTSIRARCQSLLNLISGKATELQGLRDQMTEELEKTHVPDVNNLLKEIGDLNNSIWNSQVLGNPALELQDQRNLKLDELASYLPIQVTYKDHHLSKDVILSSPEVSFVDANGTKHLLLGGEHGEDYAKLGFAKVDDKHVKITLLPAGADATDPTKTLDVTNVLKNGTLEGIVQMLNQSGPLDNTTTRGLGYYEQTFNEFVDTFAKTMNELNSYKEVEMEDGKPKLDADGNPIPTGKVVRHPLFTVIGGTVDANGNVLDKDGNPADFTAGNITINPDWMNGDIGIITSQTAGSGSTATDNLAKMVNALDSDRRFEINGDSFFTGNFSQCYANLENIQGLDSASNKSALETHISVVQKTMNNRDALSGVSLDEEGVSILQFQRSYSAAARLMTALDEMMDVLINKTGVVGR